jgi:hypothetical protein
MLRRFGSSLLFCCLALALVLIAADWASACPTCKDNLAHNGQNLARGFYYSILFMLSMPFLIFGGLCSYFYWEVCRARKSQLAQSPVATSDASPALTGQAGAPAG